MTSVGKHTILAHCNLKEKERFSRIASLERSWL
jgi:hypothetical protein